MRAVTVFGMVRSTRYLKDAITKERDFSILRGKICVANAFIPDADIQNSWAEEILKRV